jgi:hypothetical protein
MPELRTGANLNESIRQNSLTPQTADGQPNPAFASGRITSRTSSATSSATQNAPQLPDDPEFVALVKALAGMWPAKKSDILAATHRIRSEE